MSSNQDSISINNEVLIASASGLFSLTEAVLDSELNISYMSKRLSDILSPQAEIVINESIAIYLQPDHFEQLLLGQSENDGEFIVDLGNQKSIHISLMCRAIEFAGCSWMIITHVNCRKIKPSSSSEVNLEQAIFPQLLLNLKSLAITKANRSAVRFLGLDSIEHTNQQLTDLIDMSFDEANAMLASTSYSDVISFPAHLLVGNMTVMLKFCKVKQDEQEQLLCYVLEAQHESEVAEQLKRTQELSASLFESRECAVLMMDSFGVITRVNSKMTALLDERDLVGARAKTVLPKQLSYLISTTEPSVNDVNIEQQGQMRPMVLRQKPLRNEYGAVIGLLLELCVPRGAIDSLKYRALHAASLAAEHAVFITDSDAKIIFVNEVFEVQTGYPAAEVIGQDVTILKNDTLGRENYACLWGSVQNKDTWRGVLRSKKRSGVSYWSDLVVNPLIDDNGDIECIVWLSQDITMDKELKRTGTYLANYDVTTGLANAVLAKDRLEGMIGRARRRKMTVAVIYLDVGALENIEMSHGEHAAQSILTVYCERLRKTLRSEDSLARMSKSRIAILLPDLPNIDALEVVSAKVDKVNQQPLTLDDNVVELHLKQGLAHFPEQGINAESLFKNAEASLLRAWSNQSPIGYLGQNYNQKSLVHFQLRRELAQAIANERLDILYQPICEVKGDELSSLEANVRWQHPKFGLIENDEIYTLAEASGCVQELGFMLFEQICNDLVHWESEGQSQFKIGVNLSHGQLRDRNIAKKINTIFTQHGLSIERLALEIPLSYIATQWLDLEDILQELSLLGVSLQYDKFGDRGAYISDLRNFPFNGIKISQSYIQQVDSDPSAANLVEGIIAMATSLNLEVTAVGVTDLSTLLQLQEMNCHFAQGKFFSEFIARDKLSSYFIQHNGRSTLA